MPAGPGSVGSRDREPDGDGRTLADDRGQGDLALELGDELAADRQPQAVALDARMLVAGQAEEGLEDHVDGVGRDAGPGVGDGHRPGIGLRLTRRRAPGLPAGVYFSALETRLPRICWQREASVTTEALRRIHLGFPVDCAGGGGRRELAVDLVDQGADREACRGRAAGSPGRSPA